MSVAFTNQTSGSDTDGNSTATTASITRSANRLNLLTVVQIEQNGGTSTAPTCTGWDSVRSYEFAIPFGALYARITVLRSMVGSNSTGTHTIDFSSINQTEVLWSIDESNENVDTTGTNGSGAIVQSDDESALANTTITSTLGAFGSADNGTFGAFGSYGGGASNWTEGAGFTPLAEITGGFATDMSMFTQYRVDNDTSVDASIDATVDLGAISIEIKASGVPAPAPRIIFPTAAVAMR